jgi:hypothetical protein
VMSLLRNHPDLHSVLLVSRWALNSLGTRYGREAGAPAIISMEGLRGNPRAFREGFERTLRFLEQGDHNIVVVSQVPEIGWEVPSVLARARLFRRDPPASPSLAEYRERQRVVTTTLEELSGRHRFRILDMGDIFCGSGVCAVERDGLPLYSDEHHLSVNGAQWLSAAVVRSLDGS